MDCNWTLQFIFTFSWKQSKHEMKVYRLYWGPAEGLSPQKENTTQVYYLAFVLNGITQLYENRKNLKPETQNLSFDILKASLCSAALQDTTTHFQGRVCLCLVILKRLKQSERGILHYIVLRNTRTFPWSKSLNAFSSKQFKTYTCLCWRAGILSATLPRISQLRTLSCHKTPALAQWDKTCKPQSLTALYNNTSRQPTWVYSGLLSFLKINENLYLKCISNHKFLNCIQ